MMTAKAATASALNFMAFGFMADPPLSCGRMKTDSPLLQASCDYTRIGAKRKRPAFTREERRRAGAVQAAASAASIFFATSAGTHFFHTLLVLRKWMAVVFASPFASFSR